MHRITPAFLGPFTASFPAVAFCFNSSELVTKPYSHEYINNGCGGVDNVLKKFPQGLARQQQMHFCCIIFNCLQTSAGRMRSVCRLHRPSRPEAWRDLHEGWG